MAFASSSCDISQLQTSTKKIKNKKNKAYAEYADEEASLTPQRIKGYGRF